MSEKFIPITQLPSAGDLNQADVLKWDFPAFMWDFPLPDSVDQDRLLVRTSTVRTLHKVGAFTAAAVSAYHGEQTTFTPNVSGINEDGSAIASKAGQITKAPLSNSDIVDDPSIHELNTGRMGKSFAKLKINKNEVVSGVASSISSGKTVEEAWADELNLALADSYRRAASAHLLQREKQLMRRIDYVSYPVLAASYISTFDSNAVIHNFPALENIYEHLPGIYAGFMALIIGLNLSTSKLLTGSPRPDAYRWSIFEGQHQTDRYLAVNALTRVLPIISLQK